MQARTREWIRFVAACTVALLAIMTSKASAVIDPDAEIVLLRQDCTGLDDCFTTTASLTDWITVTRAPTALTPLLVDIGPGQFGQLACGGYNIFIPTAGFSHVTFRGAGRERTTIKVSTCSGGLDYLCGAVQATSDDCHHLSFQDFTAESDGTAWGAVWSGFAGDSSWTNVDIRGGRVGWYEFSFPGICNPAERAVHYWWNARIWGLAPDGFAGNGYEANCSESWFYGCDIAVFAGSDPIPGGFADGFAALSVGRETGDARLFGSTVRVVAGAANPATVASGGMIGVRVFPNGVFHMHGGIVNTMVNVTNGSESIGLDVQSGGFAHTPGASFVVTGGVQATRVRGSAQSPFQWPPSAGPPRTDPANPGSPYLISTAGSDVFVETDCSGTGNCNGGGTQTHIMVSNPACGAANPWFNATKGACRKTP
jgi:hypothetical protein